LDHLTGNGGGANDLFEQPLPGRGGYSSNDQVDDQAGQYEPKKNISSGRSRVETKADLEYKSQFLQQYEKKHSAKSQMEAQPYATNTTPVKAAEPPPEDESFMQNLRGGDDGGGWNNDTSFGGFGAAPSRGRAKPTSASKEVPSSGGKTEVVQARSRLSLLKSKIQKQSAAPMNFDNPEGSNVSLLRSNSAHHLDDDYDNGGSSYDKPQGHKAPARVARRREAEHSERDAEESSYPRSAPFQPGSKRQSAAPPEPAAPPQRIPPRRQAADAGPGKRHGAAASYEAEEDRFGEQPPKPVEASSSFNGGYSEPSEFGPGAGADDEYGGQKLECPDCHRKFNPIPYEKHVKICAKVFVQKRKVFDSSQMRNDNPDLQQILKDKKKQEALERRKKGKAVSKPEEPVAGSVASKWKQQSSAFRNAMKAARGVTEAQANGTPLPPMAASAPDPSLIPCPHCGRRFNEKAADRHIPQCQQIKARPTALKRGTGGAGGKTGQLVPPPTSVNKSAAPKPKRR
jgi:hypothetical protein